MKRLTAFFVLFLTALCFALTASAAESAIHSVAIDGNAVQVSVTAQADCALWAAAYDASGKLIAAQSESVSGASDAQTVTLSFDNIPADAYAKAFLFDKDALRPLCFGGTNIEHAILYADGTLVFQHSDAPQAGREVKETYAVDVAKSYINEEELPWYETKGSIQQIEFADKIQPKSTANWFRNCNYLKEIKNIENLDTANVTNMGQMFENCPLLTELDVSSFDTAHVTNMGYMFCDCKGLTKLDVSSFDTANVMNMSRMFYNCSGLTELDLSNFNTANVIGMNEMFCQCSGLTKLDVSNFNTANVENMWYMFCRCSSLTTLDLSSFDTCRVFVVRGIFSLCSKLTTIYASDKFKISTWRETVDMFYDCTSLVGGKGTTYDEEHTAHGYARIDGGPDNPGYFTAKT